MSKTDAGADEDGGLLHSFDWSAIEEMDPSLQGGYRMVYNREVPCEMRMQVSDEAAQEVGTLEAIKAKVLVLGSDAEPEAVRVELCSENDMFFHFTHAVDAASFKTLQEEQSLMIDFSEYANVLSRMLNKAIQEPQTHLAVFIMHRDGHARLDFIQNLEYKFIELLTVDFHRSEDDVVRQQITYRYNAVKSRLAIMQARLQDVSNVLKLKNPSLLLQLQKPAMRGAGGGGDK
jgi:hypothetical protein